MRFLIHSESGYGIGLANWLENIEGHEVYTFIKEKHFRDCGKGIITKVDTLEDGLSKSPEVVIFDLSGDGETADKLKKQGYPVLGAGKFNDLIENDRSYGMELCKKVGISVPDFLVFKQGQVEMAIKHIEETGKTYVFKSDNNAVSLTYVGKDADDLIKYLRWCDEQKLIKKDFMLQEKIEGVEVSTEVWFSQGNLIENPNGTMEIKKFMADNLGPSTDSESSVVWEYNSSSTKIVKETIGKLKTILKEMKYTGPLDINSIIAEDGTVYFLEFTPRFGYSAWYTLIPMMAGDIGEFLISVAAGEATQLKTDKKIGVCITISIPPYPLDSYMDHNRKAFELTANKRVVGIPDGYFFPFDLKKEKGEFRTAGKNGLIGYLSYAGDKLESVKEALYEKAKELEIPDIQYRKDGTERAEEDIVKLKEYGYEAPVEVL